MIIEKRTVLLIHDGSSCSRDLHSLLSSSHFALIGSEIAAETHVDLGELRPYDAVVIIAGDVFPKLRQDFVEAITTYVEEGGRLLAMPFLAWSVENKGNISLDRILPVTCQNFFENEEMEWKISEPLWKNVPRQLRFRASGEILKAKNKAKEYARDTKHNSSALVAWNIGKGSVAYVNATHHFHGGKPIQIWKNNGLRSLIVAYLEEQTINSGPRTLDVNHAVIPSHEAFRYIISHEIAHIGRTSHLAILLREQSFTLPYLFWPQDFRSLTRMERIYVCRELLKILKNDQNLKKIHIYTSFTGEKATFNQWKGRILESFASLLFLTEPGLTIEGRNIVTRTGEIDILIRNESNSGFWHRLGSPIAVECKNWFSKKVEVSDINNFRKKMEDLRVKTGFLLSRSGVTGDDFRNAIASIKDAKRKQGINLLALTLRDVEESLKHVSITDHLSDIYYMLYH